MNEAIREWARGHSWYKCSDSRNVWVIEGDKVLRFTSISSLKHWAHSQ